MIGMTFSYDKTTNKLRNETDIPYSVLTLEYVQGTFISVDNVDILVAKGQLFPFEDHSRQAHCWQLLIVHHLHFFPIP